MNIWNNINASILNNYSIPLFFLNIYIINISLNANHSYYIINLYNRNNGRIRFENMLGHNPVEFVKSYVKWVNSDNNRATLNTPKK